MVDERRENENKLSIQNQGGWLSGCPQYNFVRYIFCCSATCDLHLYLQMKGKVSRMLAAKSALAIRVDALGESTDAELGAEHKANLEAR